MPGWLKTVLVLVGFLIVLYVLGFILFGIGGDSAGPASFGSAVPGG